MISFICERGGNCRIEVTIADESDIYEVTEAFKQYLLALGFHPNTVDKVHVEGDCPDV